MARFIPDDLAEIFNDSGSEDEFEGFSVEDLETENVSSSFENFSSDDWVVGDRERPSIQFKSTPGLNNDIQLPPDAEPLDYFKIFFHDQDFETMARETNRYADVYMEKNGETLKPNSRFKKWSDETKTTSDEMKVFIAMSIGMGLTKQMAFCEYWTKDEVTETPFYKKLLSRDRAFLLMTFFHLADNSTYVRRGVPGHNPLHKLGELYTNITKRFFSVRVTNQELSLDEGMIPWRGHLSFRVYNPDKPNKYGIKAYMICDAVTGYCAKFKLYTGKSDLPVSEFGATYDLVFDMMRGFFDQGHILYMDNYYSGIKLYWDLWQCGVGATGTLRVNRQGVPKQIKEAPCKEKGSSFVMHNKHLLIMKLHDRKMVHFLSTVDRGVMTDTGKKDPRTQTPVMKPEVNVKYDKFMGGVDHSDQMVSYSTFSCRTLKWWKRVIFHVISLAIVNAYLIYKERVEGKNAMLPRNFRKKLVKQIILSVDSERVPAWQRKSGGRPVLSTDNDTVLRLQGRQHGHFPEKIVGSGKKSNVTRACVVCEPAERGKFQKENPGAKRKRYGRESSYQCSVCRKPLCVAPCFMIYHTYTDYEKKYLAGTYAAQDTDSESDD